MAKFTVNPNIDTYIKDLEKLASESETMMRESIYKGAKLMLDKCISALEALPTSTYEEKKGREFVDLTASQKAGLIEGIGIAKVRYDGTYYNMKIGVDGFNSTRTKKYPRGQPNAMILRSVEAGTYFRSRNPVISKAARACAKAAEEAMKKQLDEEIKKRIH